MRATGALSAIALLAAVFLASGTGCQPQGQAPATRVPVTEVRVADVAEPPPPLVCPDGYVRDEPGRSCLLVIHTGDAPAWKPPPGDPSTYDPCGAWSDPVGLVNCDPGNETAKAPAVDGGKK